MTKAEAPLLIHATTVSHQGRGLLICGPSGSGKSALALQMMALGADLVADDQTELTRDGARLIARAPAALHGLIEARGVGILRATAVAQAEIVLVADLSQPAQGRLPPHQNVTLLGLTLDLVFPPQGDHFPASLLCYLSAGRHA